MKDIAIEARIDRIEEVVTLSLLEQSAINMDVRDTVTGLDRYKNGIVVDAFKDHHIGETGSSQYRCSIDPKFDHLRAPFYMDQVELEDQNMTDAQKEGDGYMESNGIVTVGYSVRLVQNPLATRFINLQPFSCLLTYDGNMMTPEIDTFRTSPVSPT